MVFSKLFGVDKTPVAGLDISQDNIIFIKLKKEDNKLKLEHLIKAITPEGSVVGGTITQPELVGQTLRKMMDEHDIEDIKINVAIPSNVPFIRNLTVPDLPLEELKMVAQDEASHNIPFPVADANIDYVILDHTRRVEEGTRRLVDVFVVALQKSIAQKYLDMADEAKVRLNSIDIATFSMIKGLANAEQLKESSTIDVSVLVGYDNTDITLVSNGMPLFSHTAPIGKKNIIETINTGLGLDMKSTLDFIPQVAILVPGYATTNDPQVVKAATLVRMVYNNICTEISKAIQFYKTQKANSPDIMKIYLGGSGMCIKNAEKFIANRLKIDSELADTFKNIEVKPEQLENQDVPTLITSVGLALKGM